MTPSPRRGRKLAAAALVLLLLGTGCDQPAAAPTQTPVRIGLLTSLSGIYSTIGQDLRDGFQLYLDEHGGELGGRPITLITADEGSGPGIATPAATKLINDDKVVALTGIVSGDSFAAIAPLTTAARIPLIGSNSRPDIEDVSYIWTTSYMSSDAGTAIAGYIRDHIDGPVFAIGPDFQGGWDNLSGFTTRFLQEGGRLANPDGQTLFTPYPGTTDFMPYLSSIAGSGAKAVYCFYAGADAINFVQQYAQSPASDIPLYAAGFATEGPVLAAQGPAAEGMHTVLSYSPDLDNEVNRQFVRNWQAKHNNTLPTVFAMNSYDAAYVLDQAIAAISGPVTSENLNDALGRLGQLQSPRGTWSFNDKHGPVQRWYLRRVAMDGRTLSNLVVQTLDTVG